MEDNQDQDGNGESNEYILPDLQKVMDELSSNERADLIELSKGFADQIIEEIELLSVNTESEWVGQWERFCCLGNTSTNEKVRSQIDRYCREYGEVLDFRSRFSHAIENKCWDSIDTVSYAVGDENTRKAKLIVHSLFNEVNKLLSDRTASLPIGVVARLQQWQRSLQERYINHPIEFVQFMVDMLKRERSIIEFANQATDANVHGYSMNGRASYVQHVGDHVDAGTKQVERLQQMQQRIAELEKLSRDVALRVDRIAGEFQRLQLCTAGNVQALADPSAFASSQNQQAAMELRKYYENAWQNKEGLIRTAMQGVFYSELPKLVQLIKREIILLRRAQAYAGNGKEWIGSCDVDQLEDCCKSIAQLLHSCLDQIVRLVGLDFGKPGEQQMLGDLQRHYQTVIKDLVENTLVVEKHPPQVLMKEKKFACQLRHLLGDRIISSQQFRFDTTVQLINTEATLEILQGGHQTAINPSGRIVNNTAKSEFSEQTKRLTVNMRNMNLQMRQRGERGRADCVAEEKFSMIFRANISLRFPSGEEYVAIAQAMSLPLVVISHGKQDADAQATIFWDNAFSDPLRKQPFEVPDVFIWSGILDQLDCIWRKHCQGSGPGNPQYEVRGLDEEAKRYLSVKLLGKDDRNVMVTWRQFNRDNLPRQTFTFWTWFYKIMELVSSVYVRKHWNAGRIKGFVNKEECQKTLSRCPLGTFLLRFSDSTLGAVSISCYTYSISSGYNEVGHLEPDKIDAFKKRSLADTVKDIQYLISLYPNIPKDLAFGDSYSRTLPNKSDHPYWQKHLIVRTFNDGFHSGSVRSPGSPHSNFVSSVASPGYSPSTSSVFSPQSTKAFSPQHSLDEAME